MALTDQEVEKYVAEIADKRFAELNKTTTTEPVDSSFTLNIAGKEMKFKDHAEASSVLTNVYQEQARTQAPQVGRTVTSDTDNAGWTADDQAKYVDMLVKNPMLAQEYIDEKRFGVKNPTELIRNTLRDAQSVVSQHVIDNFVANTKDYHVSPENAAAMQSVMQELTGSRTPNANPMLLEAAYSVADKRGLIKRPETKTDYNTRESYNPYLAAPPVAGRATGRSNANFAEDLENMSIADLEALSLRSR